MMEGNTLFVLLLRTWEQIYLVLLSLIVALLIGVPIGLWIARKNKLRTMFLGIASILQTIPSLALLALFLPIFGIGFKSAIVALSIYALLPIIRNTVTGINQVDASLIEAANGLGFTTLQKLWIVELPLALPVMIAGIRTATSMSMGIATLAAFIGAGGLGVFIYQGLSLNNMDLILLGAIPAAVLALLFDFIIARIEYFFATRQYKSHQSKLKKIVLASFIVVFLIFLISIFINSQDKRDVIRIGSKDFTEQLILGEMIAEMLETDPNLKIKRKFNLGGTLFCHRAIINSEIDIYPEYTGTALRIILKNTWPFENNHIYQYVKNEYQKQFQLSFLKPFGFSNNQVLLMRKAFAIQNHIPKISDLLRLANQFTLGVTSDCLQRADCYPGLKQAYGLQFKDVKLMAPTLMYQALKDNQVDVIVGFSTDARIKAYQLQTLQDDRKFFPAYEAAPVVREDVLKRHPEIAKLLDQLSGKINDETMQTLNYQVDVEHLSPENVAHQFLIQQHLLPIK